jgi:electron transfer flavoprotein alpha subunit
VGAVLVHIDLDGDRVDSSSLTALAAGRAVASSWGATLYAAIVVEDPTIHASPDTTAQVATGTRVPALESIRALLARNGADKVVVAVTDSPIVPLWAAVGAPWQGVLDHLRPRLVLFGADAPSAAELGPRTGARIGARMLMRARAIGVDLVELRDRDGGYVRAGDGGAAVVLVGASRPQAKGDEDIDVIVLALPGGVDTRVEIAGSSPAELLQSSGVLIAIGDDVANDPQVMAGANRLAKLLGGQLIGSAAAARGGAVPANATFERGAPLAPELCVAIGTVQLDLAGTTSLVRIGTSGGKGVDGALTGPVGPNVADLVRALEES